MDENLTLLRRMFCCGIHPRQFDESYRSLRIPEQQRLVRVAERVQMTYVIRYDLFLYSQPGMGHNFEFRIEHVELTSLEVYLLLTCIDTLSGEPEYSQFDHWVRNNLEDRAYTKDEIIEQFGDYRNDFGPRSTIRQEFQSLPEAHKEWIINNVAILKSVDFPDEEIRQKNSSSVLMSLFKYFYDIRRNEYTHASKTRQTTKSMRASEEFGGWSISSSGYEFTPDKDRKNNKPRLWYRVGLDEATVLRVIIHGVVLRNLNLNPDHITIETYLMNESRRKIITGLIREIQDNSMSISWWSSLDINNVSDDFRSYLLQVGIPQLHKEWSESFPTVIRDVNFEQGYKSQFEAYVQAVENMNFEIELFNKRYQHRKLTLEKKIVWINSFVQKLVKMAEFNQIVEISNPRTINNLLLIRRDPCYT